MEQISLLQAQLECCKNPSDKIVIYNNLGVIYTKLGNSSKALECHRKELSLCLKQNESALTAYRFVAECYRNLNNYKKGLFYNRLHLETAEKTNNKLELQRSYCGLGSIYLDKSEQLLVENTLDDFERNIDLSYHYFDKSLSVARTLLKENAKLDDGKKANIKNYNKLEAEALFNIGNCYFVKGKYDNDFFKNSKEYLNKAKEMCINIDYQVLEGKCYNTQGLIHLHMKEYNSAEFFLKKDEVIVEGIKDILGWMATLQSLSYVYVGKREFDKAISCLKKACKLEASIGSGDEYKKMIENIMIDKKSYQKIQEALSKYSRIENFTHLKSEQTLEILENLEKLVDNYEDYEAGRLFLQKILKKLQTEGEGFLKLSVPEKNSFVFKLLFLQATTEKNLKNFQVSEDCFLKAISIKKEDRFDSNYISLLIDFANMLDDAKKPKQRIESLYWEGFQLARDAENEHLAVLALENMEIFYQGKKDKENLEKVKNLMRNFKQNQNPKATDHMSEEEPSDLSLSWEENDQRVYDEAMDAYELSEGSEMEQERVEVTQTKPKENSDAYVVLRKNYIKQSKENRKVAEEIQPFKTTKIHQRTDEITYNREINYETPQSLYETICKEKGVTELSVIREEIKKQNGIISFPKGLFLEDVHVKNLLDTLIIYPNLVELNLAGAGITNKTLRKFIKLLEKKQSWMYSLEKFVLEKNFIKGDEQFVKFLRILSDISKKIRHLNFSNVYVQNQEIENVIWGILGSFSSLETIGLSSCNLSLPIPEIGFYPMLSINLSKNFIDYKQLVTALSSKINLRSINLSGNKGESNFDFSSENEHTMENLNMDKIWENITEAKFKCSSGLLGNQQLIHSNSKIFEQITFLDISNNDENSLLTLFQTLHKFFLEEFLKAISLGHQFKSNLKKIKLKHSKLSNPNQTLFHALLNFLSHHRELEYLDLSFCSLSVELIQNHLVTSLAEFNKRLSYLNLCGNQTFSVEEHEISIRQSIMSSLYNMKSLIL